MKTEREQTDDLAALLIRARLEACIKAGVNEPDRSACRSSWQAVGFYLPPKKYNLVTTWRR